LVLLGVLSAPLKDHGTAFICRLAVWQIFIDAPSARENNSDKNKPTKKQQKHREHKQTKRSKHKHNTPKRFCKQSIETKKEVAKQQQIAKEKHFQKEN